MELDDNGITFQGNSVSYCYDIGVDLLGDNAQVIDNTVEYCDDDGMEIDGADMVVKSNTVKHTIDMAYEIDCSVFCNWAKIIGNVADTTYDDDNCFDIDASVAGMTVNKNKTLLCQDYGCNISGTGISHNNNVARYIGGDEGEYGSLI